MRLRLWTVLLLLPPLPALQLQADSTVNATNAFAWSANVGWVNWYADGTHGARIGEFVCAGYLYAANTGWIHLGSGAPANGIRYQNNTATDYGVNRDDSGMLRGFAYGANVGWMSFNPRTASGAGFEAPKVDLQTGRFSGFAYAANLGWISLSNAVALVQTHTVASGTDSDGDAIPDAWELIHVSNLTRLSATTDQDADGATDADEYLADTSPLDAEDTLRIQRLGFDPTGTHLLITWPTRPTRSYWIRTREGLDPPTPWIDSGLGRLYPDGDTMTRILPADHAAYHYFRIEAMRPLAPGSPAAP